MNDTLSNEFKKNVYLKPDEYLNGWARKCGWKATLVYDSLWRHADKDRKCFPSIQLMADEHGVSRDTIIRGLKTLIEYGLVTKEENRDEKGKFLHNTYTLTDKTKWRDISKSLTATRVSKSLTASSQVAHSDYKDTHTKDTHTLSIAKPQYSQLDHLSDKDFQEIADRYQVPVSFVRSKYDDMVLWAGERVNNPKTRGRNWRLTLMKWVKIDSLKLRIEGRRNDNKRGIDGEEILRKMGCSR